MTKLYLPGPLNFVVTSWVFDMNWHVFESVFGVKGDCFVIFKLKNGKAAQENRSKCLLSGKDKDLSLMMMAAS